MTIDLLNEKRLTQNPLKLRINSPFNKRIKREISKLEELCKYTKKACNVLGKEKKEKKYCRNSLKKENKKDFRKKFQNSEKARYYVFKFFKKSRKFILT